MISRPTRPLAIVGILLALAILWTLRNDYQACDLDGCMVINRWTGAVRFEPTAEPEVRPAEGSVLVHRGEPAPRARRPARPDHPRARAAAR